MEDGLNIFEIIKNLISKKYTILLSTLLFTALGYAYNYERSTKVIMKFPFSAISDSEVTKLSSINKLNLYDQKNDLGHIMKKFITKEKLLQAFIKEFNNFDLVKDVIKSHHANIDEEGLMSYVKKFKIIEDREDAQKIDYYAKISTNDTKMEKDAVILEKIFQSVTKKVKKNIIKEINNLKKGIEFSTDLKIEEIQQKIDFKTQEHFLNIEEQIRQYKYLLFLKDNFKELEVEDELKSVLKSQNFFNFIDVFDEMDGSSYSSDEDSYKIVRDYINLTNRKLPKDIKLMKLELTKLKELNYSKYVEGVIKNSDLINDEFQVIEYDMYLIEYKFIKGILEDTYLFTFAGLFLSSMMVLLVLGYKKHYKN